MEGDDIGWANQIDKKLEEYDISYSWSEIKNMKFSQWKRLVTMSTEKKNKKKLIDMCYNGKIEKQKTKRILDVLNRKDYVRGPRMDILKKSRYRSRIQIMSLFGMLDCAKNYKYGNGGELCSVCNTTDDENHRINFCTKFAGTNLCNSLVKFDFRSIFSMNNETVDRAIDVVGSLWDLRNGKNEMRLN